MGSVAAAPATPYARRLLALLGRFAPHPLPHTLVLRPVVLRDFPGFEGITGEALWAALAALERAGLLRPASPGSRVPLLHLTRPSAPAPGRPPTSAPGRAAAEASEILQVSEISQSSDTVGISEVSALGSGEGAGEGAALRDAARALLVRAADALGDPGRAPAWPLWCALAPHVFAVLIAEAEGPRSPEIAPDGAAVRRGLDPGVVRAVPRCLRGLNAAGRYRVAESRARACLAVLEDALGPAAPEAVAVRGEIAAALAGRGMWVDAEAAYWGILDAGTRPPGDPDALTVRRGIAGTLAGQGKHGAAEDMYRAILEDHLRMLGPEHPATLAVLRGEAAALAGQGRYEEAEQAFREVWHTELLTVGPSHPDALATYHGVVSAMSGQERYEEAEAAFRRLLGERGAVLGPDHPDTLATRFELALVILLLGRAEEARAEIRAVLAARIDVLGACHPLVEATRAHLP